MNEQVFAANDEPKDPKGATKEVALTEAQRRRKRTLGYLKLWGIDTDLSTLSIPLEAATILATTAETAGKAKVFCLLSLKGQGLTLVEVFAFADAYALWEHVSVTENNYILDEAAPESDDIQFAWRYEALNTLLWALGHSKHLGFPADASDPAKAMERCMQLVLNPSSSGKSMGEVRSAKQILDAADVAFALNAIALSVPADQPAPADLHRGVVYERALAFRWLLNPTDTPAR
jgi:Domain of unknown function (DUF4272)